MRTWIHGGLLADPASGLLARQGLLIEDGRIAALTDDCPDADRVIDARGSLVCPGFIDIHMHEDPVGEDGHIRSCIFDSMLRMGVTTAVGGNCGVNVYDPAAYLKIVDRDGAAVNVALFAGHGFFRERSGATDKYAPVRPEQLSRMEKEIRAALDGGCVGVSLGVRYIPGMDEGEMRAVAKCCAGRGRMISAHVRDDAAYIFDSVEEIARIGFDCGVAVQLSHIGSMGGFGQMEKLLEQIDGHRAKGLDIGCDCYPYTAFSTNIGTTTYDDGWLERYGCDYSACVPAEGKYAGRGCTKEIFDELRREDPDCITVCHVMQPEDVRRALMHPGVMVGSDGLLDEGRGHPRAAGCFPRFFREYVRGENMGLLDGISRMTSLPAQRLGLENKGSLRPGADADIVIFSPERMRDRASFEEPTLPPEGIECVLIGGEVALLDGKIVNGRLGRAVRS